MQKGMTWRLIVCLAILLGSSISSAAQQPGQRLADFRRVVVADDAVPAAKMGAQDLADYAGRISGQKIEIVPLSKYAADLDGLSFFVGEAAGEKVLGQKLGPWKTEEWLQKTVPQGLVLAGRDMPGRAASISVEAGSLLAVYTLLDEILGVKWFWPGPFGEHVPKNADAVIPVLDVRRTPEFMIRQYSVGYSSYHTPELREETGKWQRRTRQGWAPKAWFGHSWYDAFNFRDKAAQEKLLREKPEWFALVNGKRRPPQMCTTNPEVIDHMVNFVLADTKNKITSISPSDGGGFCQCDRCRALDVPGLMAYDGKNPQLSDRIFTYANEIARRVREKDPEKGVGMFAYTFYNKPPVRIKKLEPNLYLSFVYQAMAFPDPQYEAEWKQGVEEWQKVSAHMIMREGWGNHYLLDLPFIHANEIIRSFSFASQRGFLASYGEGSKAFATQAPNSWVVTRMMWNPKQDTTNLLSDFYRDAYGPAATQMQDFFETYQNALTENWHKRRKLIDTRGVAYANLINSWDVVFPAEVVAEADRYMQLALDAAPDGEYGDRVRFHQHGQEYARTMFELLRCYRQLSDMGMKIDSFANLNKGKEIAHNPALAQQLLERAYELGEKREDLLLAHRNWAALDEGLYTFINDRNMRQWHGAVKKEMGISKPTRLTKELLKAPPEPAADNE
jgi:hypothetical protein